MTVKILEIQETDAHDRLSYLKENEQDKIDDWVQKIINQKKGWKTPYYIFTHARTHDNGKDKRILWQPRLSRPKAQTNSMLFRVDPNMKEGVEVIWIIPPREMWNVYKGDLFKNDVILESIYLFEYERDVLEAPGKGDVPDSVVLQLKDEFCKFGMSN